MQDDNNACFCQLNVRIVWTKFESTWLQNARELSLEARLDGCKAYWGKMDPSKANASNLFINKQLKWSNPRSSWGKDLTEAIIVDFLHVPHWQTLGSIGAIGPVIALSPHRHLGAE